MPMSMDPLSSFCSCPWLSWRTGILPSGNYALYDTSSKKSLKWFSLFITFLIASLAAIGIAWPLCQGFLSTTASSGSCMAAKSFPLSGCPLWDSLASVAEGLLLGPVPQIPRSWDRSWPFVGRASVGDLLSPRLDFRELMGRMIDKVAFDPGRINSAHQRADS